MFNKRLITALVLGGLMFLLVASGSALAAKGGGGGHHGGSGGGGGTTTGTGTLTVSPNPILSNSPVVFSGSGWAPTTPVTVTVSSICCAQWMTTDSSGAFSMPWSGTFLGPETILVTGSQTNGTSVTVAFTVG